MELMIIECKECGNAYKGDITKPFLCPKCVAAGVTLSDNQPKKEVNQPVLKETETLQNNATVLEKLDNLEKRVSAIEDLIKKMTE